MCKVSILKTRWTSYMFKEEFSTSLWGKSRASYLNGLYLHCTFLLNLSSTFLLQASPTNSHRHTNPQWWIHGGNLGFDILPKGTSVCKLRELEIDPLVCLFVCFCIWAFLYTLRKYDVCQSERFRGAKSTNKLSYHYVWFFLFS